MRKMPSLDPRNLIHTQTWVNVVAEPNHIKSGDYASIPNALIPNPNQLLVIDAGAPVRDGAVRVRVPRIAVGSLRLVARLGAGDYSAVFTLDRVILRGGVHGAAYRDLRAFALPVPTGKRPEDIEVELRVVGPRISVSANGVELGAVEDASVTSGAFAAGSFKAEKVPLLGFDYMVIEAEKSE